MLLLVRRILSKAVWLAISCVGCALIFTVAPPVFGQQPAAPKPPRLRFLFLDETPGAYFVKVGEQEVQVSSNPYELSSPFVPATFDRIDLFKAGPHPDPATGGIALVKVAAFSPPNNTPVSLVIVTPRPPIDATSPAVYAVELIDGNPEKFPAGSVRIINRGRTAMAARFGISEVVTAAGDTRIVRPLADRKNRVFFKIAVQGQQNGGWQMLQDSLAVIRPEERMIGILVYSPGGMKHLMTPSELREFGTPKPGHFWLTCTDSP